MIRLVRSLAAAALATSALAATPAQAGPIDASITIHFPARPRHVPPPPPPPPPPPQVVYVPVGPTHHECDRHCRHERAHERQRELRHEYRELERARERFYATWNGSPGKQRRFERWYAGRRAELDARWARVGGPSRWGRG